MLTNSNSKSRRRPVDALFGEQASAATNYTVEPPQPANSITPPDVEPNEPVAETPFESNVLVPSTLASEPPRFVPPPVEPIPEPASANDPRFLTLSFQIERLYDDVKSQLQDSPKLTERCFDLLLQARQAYEQGDHAHTEFYLQSTDALIERTLTSAQASRSLSMVGLWMWQLFAMFVGVLIVALSYISGLTLFGLPVALELVVLIRTLGWGMIGGVIGAMYNLTRFVQRREYDPAYAMHYFARPLVGALLGALLFVVSQAGIIAGNIIIGDFKVGPIFLYVFAVLAGFKQEYVGDFFDNLVKALFGRQPK
jgi:hypothetical protein